MSYFFDKQTVINSHKQKKIIKEIYSKKDFGLDLSLEELAIISATYPSAQQYGPKFEKWMNNFMRWESVKSSLGRGDSKISNKDVYIEQKWNIRTDVGPGGLQHRFWQPINYYLYGHVDDSNSDNIIVYLYLLTKEQAEEEAKILKASPTHGTKAVNINNEKVEYSFSVMYNSFHHERWKNKYMIELEKLKKYEF